MPHTSLNPATGQVLQTYPSWDATRLQQALQQTHAAQQAWAQTDLAVRAEVLKAVANSCLPNGIATHPSSRWKWASCCAKRAPKWRSAPGLATTTRNMLRISCAASR